MYAKNVFESQCKEGMFMLFVTLSSFILTVYHKLYEIRVCENGNKSD